MKKLLDTVDFKNLRKIRLQLGSECNMYCRHCHQTPEKKYKTNVLNFSEETIKFLENFVQFSQSKNFTEDAVDNNFFTIEFYGGEALLHWETIKKTIIYFEEKFHFLDRDTFRFVITSNGLGLTEEIVSFLNQYNVIFDFSYDAPFPWAVRGYVSDKICELANKIKHLHIICSGCAYNCDPVLANRCLMCKFPEANYTIRTEVLRTFPEMDLDIDNYSEDKLRISIRRLFISAKLKETFSFDYVKKLLYPLMYPETNYFHNNNGVNTCVSGFYQLTVRPDGYIPFCYNCGDILGSLSADSLESIYQKAVKTWKDMYDPACSSCSVRDLCSWGCKINLRDNKKHMYICEKYRKIFFKIVKEEINLLLEPLSKENYDWYQKEQLIMDKQVQMFLKEGKRYEKEHTRFPKEMF